MKVVKAVLLLSFGAPLRPVPALPAPQVPACATLFETAESLATGSSYRRAYLECFRSARAAAARRDTAGAAEAYYRAAEAASQLDEWDRADTLYRSGLTWARRSGDPKLLGPVLWGAAVAARNIGQTQRAESGYSELGELSAATGDSTGLGASWHGLALIAMEREDFPRADSLFRRAIALRSRLSDTLNYADSIEGLALLEWSTGLADSALIRMRAVMLLTGSPDDPDPVTALNLAALHRELGRPDSALHYAALARPGLVRSEQTRELARLHNEHGLAYIDLSFQDPRWRDSALAVLGRAGTPASLADRAALWNNLGVVHRLAGRTGPALAWYRRAEAVTRRMGDRRALAMVLNNRGLVYIDRRKPDSALPLLRESLRIRRAIRDVQGEWQTLGNIADAYVRAYAVPRVPAASAWYAEADSVLRGMGRRTGSDAERLSYADQKWNLDLYRGWTSVWLTGGCGGDACYAALAAAERGRALAFLELRKTSDAPQQAVRDAAAEGRDLVRRTARPGRAVLSYMLLESSLVAWIIGPDGRVSVARTEIAPDSLRDLIAGWRGAILSAADTAIARSGRVGSTSRRLIDGDTARGILSELLFPGALRAVLPEIRELVLIPHGMLATVPFAALPVPRDGPPIGHTIALRYAPSLTTLLELEGRASGGSGAIGAITALVVGDPDPGAAGSGLPRLKAAGREAEAVARFLGTRSFEGGEATERRVRELLPGADVIHLATHGVTYTSAADYRESHLLLAPGSGGDDGRLTVAELLAPGAPQLKASLVVLSACETGLGNLRQSEGTVGLQRAFLARGARSVLVSLWAVDDRATELLMTAFYRFWLEGKGAVSRAEALARAQQWLVRETEYKQEWYWAAFQLVGSG